MYDNSHLRLVDVSRHAKVANLGRVHAIQQHIACSQVPVHVSLLLQVCKPSTDMSCDVQQVLKHNDCQEVEKSKWGLLSNEHGQTVFAVHTAQKRLQIAHMHVLKHKHARL